MMRDEQNSEDAAHGARDRNGRGRRSSRASTTSRSGLSAHLQPGPGAKARWTTREQRERSEGLATAG